MRQSACLALLCAPLLGAVDWRAEFEAWLTAEATRLWDAREHRLFALDSRPALERYQQEVREKALRLIGGLPPVKTALNARVTGIFSRPGYRVEKVIFESLPGYRVTANLYLPGGVQGRVPAVLGVAGHSLNGKASATYQHAFVGMARRGMAVLAWDPPGQGERLEYFDAASGRSRVGESLLQPSGAGLDVAKRSARAIGKNTSSGAQRNRCFNETLAPTLRGIQRTTAPNRKRRVWIQNHPLER